MFNVIHSLLKKRDHIVYAPLSALQMLTAKEDFFVFVLRSFWLVGFVLIQSNCYLLNQE